MRYFAFDIPENFRNPETNVLLIPCWAEDVDQAVIEIPDNWQYPLPDPMPEPLPPAPDLPNP
jgi:hypothetical protein